MNNRDEVLFHHSRFQSTKFVEFNRQFLSIELIVVIAALALIKLINSCCLHRNLEKQTFRYKYGIIIIP